MKLYSKFLLGAMLMLISITVSEASSEYDYTGTWKGTHYVYLTQDASVYCRWNLTMNVYADNTATVSATLTSHNGDEGDCDSYTDVWGNMINKSDNGIKYIVTDTTTDYIYGSDYFDMARTGDQLNESEYFTLYGYPARRETTLSHSVKTPTQSTSNNDPVYVAPTQEEVAKLYVATFNRAPDSAGLSYWVNNSGLTLSEIAKSFFVQPETQTLYPAGTTVSAFIQSVYQNLFNRAPDSAGLSYWEDDFNLRGRTRDSFILAMINGAQDNADGMDKTILNNKNEVGLYFANAGLGEDDFPTVVMSGVTASSDTVSFIKGKIANGSLSVNVWNGVSTTPQLSVLNSQLINNGTSSINITNIIVTINGTLNISGMASFSYDHISINYGTGAMSGNICTSGTCESINSYYPSYGALMDFPIALPAGSFENIPSTIDLSQYSNYSNYGYSITGGLTTTYTYYTNNGSASSSSTLTF